MVISHQYEKINTSDGTRDPVEAGSASGRSRISRIFFAAAKICLATLLVTLVLIWSIFAMVSLQRREPAISSLDIIGCGNTTSDARRQGCVFDVMMQLWVPPRCYNHELSEQFLAEGQWRWYRDPLAEQEMPDDEMRRGEHEVAYVIDSYHRQHCVYTWQLTVRSLRDRTYLLEEMLNYEHVHHCRMILMAPERNRTKEAMGVRAVSGSTTCASYEAWLGQINSASEVGPLESSARHGKYGA